MKKKINVHIQRVLQQFEPQLNKGLKSQPFDKHLKQYFKENKKLEDKEKFKIVGQSYQILREKMYLDRLVKGLDKTWEDRIKVLYSQQYYDNKNNQQIPMNVRTSCPPILYEDLYAQFQESKVYELSESMISKAPLTIRNNPLKISRKQLRQQLQNNYRIQLGDNEQSPFGLNILNDNLKLSLYEMEEFQNGLFEIQDEASQLVALQVQCTPGQQVLDFCAGTGGKSLLIGSQLQNKGQLFLHDIRESSLLKAKTRIRRAGIKNAQYHSNTKKLKKNKFDWVVLDVPCSGTGTLRRNPDLKWKLVRNDIEELVQLQRQIIDQSIKYLKQDGKLVYITCSLLQQENIDQIIYICDKYNMKLKDDNYFQSFTTKNGMDSLFAATLQFV